MRVPELLLCIPVVQVSPSYISTENKLYITVTQAAKELELYKQNVEHFLNDRYASVIQCNIKNYNNSSVDDIHTSEKEMVDELEEAIRFALCLFNAENFTGELCPSEEKELSRLLIRFTQQHGHTLVQEHDANNTHCNILEEKLEEDEEEQQEKKEFSTEDKSYHSSTVQTNFNKYCQRLLMTDGEAATPCVRLPALLLCLIAIISAHKAQPKELAKCTNTTNKNAEQEYEEEEEENIREQLKSEMMAPQLTDDNLVNLTAEENRHHNDDNVDEDAEHKRKHAKQDPVNQDATLLLPICSIWRVRVLFRHQLCLLHRSHTLYKELSHYITAIMQMIDKEREALLATSFTVSASNLINLRHRTETSTYLIEIGHIQNYYHKREAAAESFNYAMAITGLQLHERTIMGVRTRWQQQQYVQMILDATSQLPLLNFENTEKLITQQQQQYTSEEKKEEVEHEVMEKVEKNALEPLTVMSEKDGHDLLDVPRSSPDTLPSALPPLHPLDKAIIVALCHNLQNTNPHHGLTVHHMQTYVERLLATEQQIEPCSSCTMNDNENGKEQTVQIKPIQHTPFVIKSQILLLRTRLERHRNRVQERAFMQLTELIEQYQSKRNPAIRTLPRTFSDLFYTVAFPSIWELQNEYAEFCFDETLYKTALDCYEQTQNWPKIIDCCKKLDKRRRAESLARELLKDDPHNPMLYVALGEATREDKYLWQAWELGEHQLAAPMRALAQLALEREQYRHVMDYFDSAVAINPLFGGDWFTLGYAALRLHEYQRGCEAFTRVCQIDPNNAFAWNNLASLLMREHQLRPAFNAMSQALRHNRRDWRMWINYFEMAVQLREVTEAAHALRIAMEIAKRNLQVETLNLREFVSITLLYLQHKIPGSTRDECEGDSVVTLPHNESSNTNDNDDNNVVKIPHATLGQPSFDENNKKDCNQEIDDGNEFAELIPFGADIDYNETNLSGDVTNNNTNNNEEEEEEEHARVEIEVRQRHGIRVRELFHDLCELFVTLPDLYSAAAELYTFFDGPIKGGYEFHLKELRACRHKDQWERDRTKFARTVQALQSLVSSALDAFEMVKAKYEDRMPPAANHTPININNTNTNVSEEEVIASLKDAQNNIKAVLEASQEHMETTEEYAQLRALSAKIRAAVQEAKATFV